MPRPKNINPTVPTKVYLSQTNSARLQLITLSTVTGRNAYGSTSQIINEALDQYFRKEQACTPPKQKPESNTSESPPKAET